jgi:hypothetical protein
MGTSSNHRSKDIPTWQPARAMLGSNEVDPKFQARELWRAALSDQEAAVIANLSNETVAFACDLAATSQSPIQANDAFTEHLQAADRANLFDSIARRALIRSVVNKKGIAGFGEELFAEAVSYFASRDLPSYVGREGRVTSVSSAIALKEALKSHTADIARKHQLRSASPKDWGTYVLAVLKSLGENK